MGKLTDEQARQLAELEQLRDAPEPEPDDDDDDQGDDDGGVIVLRGKRADTFLTSLLGSGKRGKRGNSASAPASTEGKGDAAGDDGDQGDDGEPEPTPKPTHRYFR